ncbi:DUF2066 domain-containing protein [Vibrio sp. ABG19]|uniref:DUF2066 domain-containing protein n=1 Tax=Vibrio sp. ABG19 TaxID=2817385 RepID=UPI00249E77A4|nr:DUF2066 domain-containing protein [Vibrio sp. ABG19]WGY47614.1 DUF2066 domain-containing protein [Vibrio sp. ABG19]
MRYLAWLMMGLMSLPAFALTKVNLYQTEVVLDQQQDNADAAARAAGLQQVIIRASGNKDAASNSVVQKALGRTSQYLNQISYAQQDDAKVVRMGFSAPNVRALLTQAQLPFWPQERANLLVWLVEESDYDRSISWEHSDSALLKHIRLAAAARGLPLTVPVGDFDDITGAQISDLWGGFSRPISQASQRYATDAVLVVRAQGSDLRWTLYDQQAESMISAPKTPLNGQASGADAATQMVDELSDYYAKQNAVVVNGESSQAVLAAFKPIDGAIAFFTLEEQLQRLSSVASLDIVKIQGDEVTFKVNLLTSEAEFEQEALRIGAVGKREAPPAPLVAPVPEVTPQPLSDDASVTDEAEIDGAAVPAQESSADPISPTDITPVLAEPTVAQAPLAEPEPQLPALPVLYFSWQQ